MHGHPEDVLPLAMKNLHQYSQQAAIGIVSETKYPAAFPKVHGYYRSPALFQDLVLVQHTSWMDVVTTDCDEVRGTAQGPGPPQL